MQFGRSLRRHAWMPSAFLIAIALRLQRARQSLWGDEMDSLFRYVHGPWRATVAARAGEYIPNDHVLYNLLARLCLFLGTGGSVEHPDAAALCVRLPSVIAGSILPIAIAWPLRRRAPLLAALLAIVTAVHPWLVAQAAEARGYALMALLGVVATWLLPGAERRWPLAYAMAIALALYTVPVAVLLVAGHGLFVLTRRRTRANWMRGVTIAAVITVALYAPMLPGMSAYFRHPMPEPGDVADFANQLPRFAMFGRYLPASYDPTLHAPGPSVGVGYLIVPLLLLVIGTAAARRRPELWPLAAPLLATTLFAVALAIVMPAAGQMRFLPWAGLSICIATVALLMWLLGRLGATATVSAATAVIGLAVWADVAMPPEQPLREGVALADHLAPPGAPVVLPFFTADPPSAALYAAASPHHALIAAGPPPMVAAIESQCRQTTGQGPWLVMSFEFLARDLAPDAWRDVNDRYRLVARLPGRTSPVAIYAPRD